MSELVATAFTLASTVWIPAVVGMATLVILNLALTILARPRSTSIPNRFQTIERWDDNRRPIRIRRR